MLFVARISPFDPPADVPTPSLLICKFVEEPIDVPAGPDGPVGPVGPVGPAGPVGPVGPVPPFDPLLPAAPF